jgi:HTH-type transcriptional regulator/antitoxin HigA
MNIKPIHNEADYKKALRRLELIFDAKKGTSEGDELEILGILIENYEKINHEIEPPDPVEAILFRMDQMGYSQKDLDIAIGQKTGISEILSRKKKLSLSLIRKINIAFNISAEVLIRRY